MVCSPSSRCDGTGGRTGRAGGQHCDESGGNRLLSGHVCPVGAARGRDNGRPIPRQPPGRWGQGQVGATPASTSRSPTRVDRSFSGHKAGGNPSQALAGLHDEQHGDRGASRQVKRQAPSRWLTGSDLTAAATVIIAVVDHLATPPQLGGDAWGAVGALRAGVDAADLADQAGLDPLGHRRPLGGARRPGVVGRPAHPSGIARGGDGEPAAFWASTQR
jgi:hypothetical protein